MTGIEPIPLALWFGMSHGFRKAWEETITRAADQAMAEIVTHPGMDEAALDGFLHSLDIHLPWPGGLIAGPESIEATFSWHAKREIARRCEKLGN